MNTEYIKEKILFLPTGQLNFTARTLLHNSRTLIRKGWYHVPSSSPNSVKKIPQILSSNSLMPCADAYVSTIGMYKNIVVMSKGRSITYIMVMKDPMHNKTTAC